jgi:hypothetical protein
MVERTTEDNRELDNQISSRGIHCFSHVSAHVLGSTGRSAARCTIGSVPDDSRCMGNLRFTLRETEVALHARFGYPLRGEKMPHPDLTH